MTASRFVRAQMSIPYAFLALILVILGGRLLSVLGALIGLGIGAVMALARSKRVEIVFDVDALVACNGGVTSTLQWVDVGQVDVRYKYFGLGTDDSTLMAAMGGIGRGGLRTAHRQCEGNSKWESGSGEVELIQSGVREDIAWLVMIERNARRCPSERDRTGSAERRSARMRR